MRPNWLTDEAFPFQSRWIEIGPHHVHYVDEGSGPALLFVHAGPAWTFVFRGLIENLRGEFRCIALDMPGSGLSNADTGYIPTMRSGAEVVREFVAKLDLAELALVVNDVGTPVALGALRGSGLPTIRGIVVAEGFGWSLASHNPKVVRILRFVSSRPAVNFIGITNLMALVTSTRFGVGRHLSRADKAVFRGPYRSRQVRRNAPIMLGDAAIDSEFLQEVDGALHSELSATPLLTVFGAKSPAVKEGFPEQWKARMPHARQLIVSGGHHFPHMDDPCRVAQSIRNWWREDVAAAGSTVARA